MPYSRLPLKNSHISREGNPKSFLRSNQSTSLHTKTAPATRTAVEAELSYRNDQIMVFFVLANKNKETPRVALASCYISPEAHKRLNWGVLCVIFVEEQQINFGHSNTIIILPGNTRQATSELPEADNPFLGEIKTLETQNVSYFSKQDLNMLR